MANSPAAATATQVFSLEIECKKLTRALVREVGEDVPLSRVLDDGSDWKGRREQIVALKAQVQTLKAAQVRCCFLYPAFMAAVPYVAYTIHGAGSMVTHQTRS